MVGLRVLSFLSVLLISLPVWAGGGITWFRPVSKALGPQETRFKQLIALQMQRTALETVSTLRTARLTHASREELLHSPYTAPFQTMAPLSVPLAQLPSSVDPIFALRNDQMALSWFGTIEKDLAFLREQRETIAHTLRKQKVPLQEVNYAQLIPAKARKIFVGEEHDQPVIYEAFEKMIFQYKEMYPERKIIILTEFVSDRLLPWQMPGRPVRRMEMPLRRQGDDFKFFNKFISEGIEVIGLENIAYIKEHEALITPSESQAQSVYGMQERNAHWRSIIGYVADHNPDAILFIYAGSMHTHYRAPFSLATPSPQNFVFQFEANYLGRDMPFGYVMQYSTLPPAEGGNVLILSWPTKSTLSTRSGFDACLIFPEVEKK